MIHRDHIIQCIPYSLGIVMGTEFVDTLLENWEEKRRPDINVGVANKE